MQVLQGDHQPISPRRRKSRSTAPPDRLQGHAAAQAARWAAGHRSRQQDGQMRSHGASEGSPGSGRLRSSCGKASVTGRYGALAEVGTARPIPTGTCRPAAIRASSTSGGTCRCLALPVVTTQPPRPDSAPARADSSAWISARRPARTGHSTSPTIPVAAPAPGPVNDHQADARWALPVCPVTHSRA